MNFDPRCTDARALDFHWRAPGAIAERAGLAELGRSSYKRARDSLLASLVLASDSDRPWVSYSRSRDFYAAEGRYEGTDYTYSNVRLAVAEILEAGLIEEMRSKPGAHLAHGFQSRMLATDRLMSLAEGVDLQHIGSRCPIVMKDENGSRIDFRETTQTRKLVREVEEVNTYLGQIQVGISADASPDDWQHTRHHIRARKVRDGRETWTCVRPTPSPEVFRVFGRGRWDRHGRWYGWWQNLPKARRAELLINDELCIEPDFACLHPALLYALRGVVLQHDPYELRGWDRSAGKLALNVAINAKSIPVGISALLLKRGDANRDGSPAWPYGPAETRRIVEAVKKANPVIAADIGSDAGIRLMSIDSGMAHAVMKRSRAAGISVLPVHDSFIAPRSRGAEVTAIMGDVMAHTISTISPVVSTRSMQSIRYTPLGGATSERSSLPSLEETSPAEPEIAPSPEGRGNTLPSLETPLAEPVGGPAGGGTAPFPEGQESLSPEASWSASSLLAAPSPEARFRPVLAVRRPAPRPTSPRPVVSVAPPSPPPLAPPAPVPDAVPTPRPPLPPFLQAIREEMRIEDEAAASAAAAAALVRESAPPPASVRGRWAPLPPRKDSPAPMRVEAPVAIPAPPEPVRRPQVEVMPVDQFATLRPSAPGASLTPQRPMTREEVSANLKVVAERARLRMEARERDRERTAYR